MGKVGATKSCPPPRSRAKSGAATSTRGRTPVKKQEPEEERAWDYRLADARRWGEKLRKCGGAGPQSTRPVKNLLKTLKDSRCLSEVSLRRTAIEALLPAAEIGHRGALAAQVERLLDSNDVVRRSALLALRDAAGGQRPQLGGAVAVALAEAMPPRKARYDLETRRRAADAVMRLAPVGDEQLLLTAAAWSQDDDPYVRLSATQTLGIIDCCKENIEAIVARLNDSDWRVSRAAVQALEQVATGKEPLGRRGSVTMGTVQLPDETDSTAPRRPISPKQKPSSPSSQYHRASSASSSTPSMSAAGLLPRPTTSPAIGEDARRKGQGQAPQALRSLSRSNTATSVASEAFAGRPKSGKRGSSKDSDVSDHSSHQESRSPDSNHSRPESRQLPSVSVVKALTKACSGDAGLGVPCTLLGVLRSDAVSALARTAKPGDLTALRSVTQRLADGDANVREKAQEAFEVLAKGDPTSAMRMSVRVLSDLDFRVRGAAAKALIGCAKSERGIEDALNLAAANLEKQDWRSRRGIGQTLRSLDEAHRSMETEEAFTIDSTKMALQALIPRLHHTDWSVRRKTVQAIATVAEGNYGSAFAVDLLAAAANDVDEEVLLEVARALPSAAPRRCKAAVAIAAVLADANLKAASDAPRQASKSSGAPSAPTIRMDSKASSLTSSKSAAASKLAPLAEVPPRKLHQQIIRVAGLDALEQLAGEGRSNSRTAVHAAGSLLDDLDPKICEVAERVFCTVGRGRRCAVDFLAKLLQHREAEVRERAARCFVVATLDLRSRALKRTMPLIRHQDAGVRAAAGKATAAFMATAEQESVAVQCAAAVMARFRKDRFPNPHSPIGSRAGSDRSNMSKHSHTSKGSRMSKCSRVSILDQKGSNSENQRFLLAMKAKGGSGKAPSEAPSRLSKKSAGSGSKGSTASKSKLAALLSGNLSKATVEAEKEKKSALAAVSRLEERRRKEMEEIENLEREPREQDFDHSDTDDEVDKDVETESEAELLEDSAQLMSSRRSRRSMTMGSTLSKTSRGALMSPAHSKTSHGASTVMSPAHSVASHNSRSLPNLVTASKK